MAVLFQKVVQTGALVASCLGLSSLALVVLSPFPAIAQFTSPLGDDLQNSAAAQRLSNMFSAEIQATLEACTDQGKVDLVAGAGEDGLVICGDGSSEPGVAYADYLDTVSDLLTASSLVAFRTAMGADPRVTPEMLAIVFLSPEGAATMSQAVETAIVQNQLLPPDAEESTALLADEVVSKLQNSFQNLAVLEGLLGTDEQYAQVVSNFCTAPGMSVDQAQRQIPGLSSIQLYAICVQESGIADEVLQLIN
jgi:hypothetical protein